MKVISASIFALALGFSCTSCKDDVDKAADCKTAATEYINAHTALQKSLSEATCEARNAAILNYREKCEKLPDGADTVNCNIKENIEGLFK